MEFESNAIKFETHSISIFDCTCKHINTYLYVKKILIYKENHLNIISYVNYVNCIFTKHTTHTTSTLILTYLTFMELQAQRLQQRRPRQQKKTSMPPLSLLGAVGVDHGS